MDLLKKLSLAPKGIRRKFTVAFCLMAMIPLLVAAYLLRDKIFPPTGDIIETSWILFFSVILALLGLVLARQLIMPVIDMAIESKLIAGGMFDRRISVSSEDEIGELGSSINSLTSRIRRDMDELNSYGEKTKLINIEIHKKVLALSSLLQISEEISMASDLDGVMALIADKTVEIMNAGYAVIYLPRPIEAGTLESAVENNLTNEKLRDLKIRPGKDLLGEALLKGAIVYADSGTKRSKDTEMFMEDVGVENFAAFPIISRGKAVGMMLAGSRESDYTFNSDDMDVLKIFSKQAAIAYDREILIRKARELAIKDDLTGLYNEAYVTLRLGEEIKRGVLYQRPCSYVMFNVDGFDKFRSDNGELVTEKALKMIASVLEEHVTQIGRAARLSGDEFALLLPEKNKKEAYRIAEAVRKTVENIELGSGSGRRLTISGGVSENPIDGSSSESLKKKAADSVAAAKTQGKNKII
ncbi:MAG: diguanylate cyclase [Candidatus Omnitrophica bacterium]|nr:diguanylate cyclase [Candidatus Omnitrophota bacterium]